MQHIDSPNLVWQTSSVTSNQRSQSNGHKALALWFTGLSGAGKSTIANALEKKLFDMGCQVYVLDGDNVRHGLCGDLGFTSEDRTENIRRVGEVTKLFVDAGFIVITAFISPFDADRAMVKTLFDKSNFIEVYCNADIQTCETRDVKGLYAKARKGEVTNFTGISSPYEPPLRPDVVLDTAKASVGKCAEQLVDYLKLTKVFAKD